MPGDKRALARTRREKTPTSDFVGYEVLVDFMNKRALYRLEGDIVEIGAFMGGGTVKLANFARKYGKRVFVVDNFDPSSDKTEDVSGTRMCDIYQALLGGRSQWEVYQEATRGVKNLTIIKGDSKEVRFPEEQRFVFGFIDGNHQPDYVRNDFSAVWPHLVSGGALGFHDYGGELPGVTKTIDWLIEEHRREIAEVHHIEARQIILLVRR